MQGSDRKEIPMDLSPEQLVRLAEQIAERYTDHMADYEQIRMTADGLAGIRIVAPDCMIWAALLIPAPVNFIAEGCMN